MIHSYELEAKTWAPGAKLITQMSGLPKGQRVTHIMIELDAMFGYSSNQTDWRPDVPGMTPGWGSSAPTDNIEIDPAGTPEYFARLLTNIDVKSDVLNVRATGKLLTFLYQHMSGHMPSMITHKFFYSSSQPGNSDIGDKPGTLIIIIPCSDPKADNPHDSAVPTELLEGRTIEFQCASSNQMWFRSIVKQCTIRATVWMIPGNGAVVPVQTRIDWEDWNQQTALLRPGTYPHLFIYDENDGLVRTSEYARVRLQMDGNTVVDRLRSKQLIADYNHRSTSSNANHINLETSGLIPVLTAGDKYKLSQIPSGSHAVRADIEGDMIGARFAYRIVEPRVADTEIRSLQRLGVPDPERQSIEVKTASKEPLKGGDAQRIVRMRRTLPVRSVA